MSLQAPPSRPTPTVIDSGRLSGADNMRIDQEALDAALAGRLAQPILRLFEWSKPTVTYGYLLDASRVGQWAESMDPRLSSMDIIKRPTGGGAVYHSTTDLSFSLLWTREAPLFSEHPRECYAQIHAIVKNALATPLPSLSLKMPGAKSCEATGSARFSACFQEPVCNDVMLDDKKIVGGALRVTKRALLYQGTIQLNGQFPVETLKRYLRRGFSN